MHSSWPHIVKHKLDQTLILGTTRGWGLTNDEKVNSAPNTRVAFHKLQNEDAVKCQDSNQYNEKLSPTKVLWKHQVWFVKEMQVISNMRYTENKVQNQKGLFL